ncbi:MAG: Maf family protein [Gammaproteobacteria bacterium]
MTEDHQPLILASSSAYRRELLSRLGVEFSAISPDVDETPRPNETPAELAARLAGSKAETIHIDNPGCVVIGSDQVASLQGLPLGKPGDHATAVSQLSACSGKQVQFHTAVSVLGDNGFRATYTDLTTVQFRALETSEIEAYLLTDKPYDCAGSFRSEGLGITLFEAIENRDPTALIGLPLIWLAGALRDAGISLVQST